VVTALTAALAFSVENGQTTKSVNIRNSKKNHLPAPKRKRNAKKLDEMALLCILF
jgi:hypothetical protein